MSIEWDTGMDCEVVALDQATANDEYPLGGAVTEPFVLLLGGGGGGCLAVEGTVSELRGFAQRVRAAVAALEA